MKRDELRALQAPLKDHYRDEPGTAIVTLSATGSLGEGVSCSRLASAPALKTELRPT